MSTVIWRGSVIEELPIKQEQGLKGGTITRTWRGQKQAITDLFNQRVATTRDTCEVSNVVAEGSPVWQLTSTIAYEMNPAEARFELAVEKASKDLLNADIPMIQVITQKNKEALLKYVQHPEKYYDRAPEFTGSLAQIGDATKAYKCLAAGHKQVLVFVPVLKQTYQTLDTSNFTNNISLNGKIRKTNDLISQLGIPGSIAQLLPPSGDYTALSGITLDPRLPTMYYGWMQHPPQITATAMPYTSVQAWNWVAVTQEYHYGLWNTYTYTVV